MKLSNIDLHPYKGESYNYPGRDDISAFKPLINVNMINATSGPADFSQFDLSTDEGIQQFIQALKNTSFEFTTDDTEFMNAYGKKFFDAWDGYDVSVDEMIDHLNTSTIQIPIEFNNGERYKLISTPTLDTGGYFDSEFYIFPEIILEQILKIDQVIECVKIYYDKDDEYYTDSIVKSIKTINQDLINSDKDVKDYWSDTKNIKDIEVKLDTIFVPEEPLIFEHSGEDDGLYARGEVSWRADAYVNEFKAHFDLNKFIKFMENNLRLIYHSTSDFTVYVTPKNANADLGLNFNAYRCSLIDLNTGEEVSSINDKTNILNRLHFDSCHVDFTPVIDLVAEALQLTESRLLESFDEMIDDSNELNRCFATYHGFKASITME